MTDEHWKPFISTMTTMFLACGRNAPDESQLDAYWRVLRDLNGNDVIEAIASTASTWTNPFQAPPAAVIRARAADIEAARYANREKRENARALAPVSNMPTPEQWEEIHRLIRSIGR